MRTRRIIEAVTAVVLASTLAGCALLGGIMSESGDQGIVPPAEFSSKTGEQTLDDTLAHTEDLVRFLGGDWYDDGVPRELFDPTVRSGWSGGPCGAAGTDQYSIHVRQVVPVADPLAKIEQVREHWKRLGYRVRQLGPAEADEELLTHIFVDLPFGAGLEFNASTTGMAISTQGECYIVQ